MSKIEIQDILLSLYTYYKFDYLLSEIFSSMPNFEI